MAIWCTSYVWPSSIMKAATGSTCYKTQQERRRDVSIQGWFVSFSLEHWTSVVGGNFLRASLLFITPNWEPKSHLVGFHQNTRWITDAECAPGDTTASAVNKDGLEVLPLLPFRPWPLEFAAVDPSRPLRVPLAQSYVFLILVSFLRLQLFEKGI